jgi:hypothetical protein
MKLLRTALLVTAAVSAHVANAQMATPTQFSVSPGGGALYTVPIRVAPGVGGMEPKVALVYNSQAGNGIAGLGWSIDGVSAISRCPQTAALDNSRGDVSFQYSDRFCLDGERLLVVSGAYGGDGAEYRTEHAAFSRIKSYGVAGNGPAWFRVWAKSGQVIDYGGTSDSRLESDGNATVASWAISSVRDVRNNAMTYSYAKVTSQGHQRLSRIDYGGNSVEFAYVDRPDLSYAFEQGLRFVQLARLTGVYVNSGATRVRTYSLAYDDINNSWARRSRLKSIQETDASGQSLPALVFDWMAQSPDLFFPYGHELGGWGFGEPPTAGWDLVTGDFDGDGRIDFAFVGDNPNYILVSLSNGDGTFRRSTQQVGDGLSFGRRPSDKWQLVTGDFNGDGRTDFAYVGGSPCLVHAFLSNGDGTFLHVGSAPEPTWNFGNPPANSFSLVTGDFDGDGRTDFALVGNQPTNAYAFLSNGNGTFRPQQTALFTWNFETPPEQRWDLVVGDFNGDGKTDFGFVGESPTHFYLTLSNGDGTFRWMPRQDLVGWNFGVRPSAQYTLVVGDFNGDGKTDLAYVGGNPSMVHTLISKGDGTFIPIQSTIGGWYFGSPPTAIYTLVTGDFDGDGRTDFGFVGANPSFFHGALSNGDGVFRAAPQNLFGWYFGAPPTTYWTLVTGDFNGDGKTDFSFVGSAPSSVLTSFARPELDAIVRFSDGQQVVDVSYKHFPELPGLPSAATYPQVGIKPPVLLVTQSAASNGVGGSNTVSYAYEDLKAELGTGRGVLGFKRTTRTNVDTGLYTTVEYDQNYPFTGMILRTETHLPVSGSLVQRFTNTWGQDASAAAPSRFTFLTQSVEEGWDLNGVALPTVTKLYTYAQSPQYGDPTRIVVTTSDGASKTTVNEYWPANTAGDNWILGRLKKATVTSTSP